MMEETKFVKYGWEYGYSKEKGGLYVTPKEEKARPKTLFKYYALNENSIDALSHGYLYASHPDQFNDPLDCSIDLLDLRDPIIIKKWLKEEREDLDLLEIVKKVRSNDPDFYQKRQSLKETIKQSTYNVFGIICLVSNPENLLMWSHYSNHNGFCLEFDYKNFQKEFIGPFPMNYQNKLTPIEYNDENYDLIYSLYQSNVKLIDWKYEDEWRFLALNEIVFDKEKRPVHLPMRIPNIPNLKNKIGTERKISYPPKCISSITLGYRFFNNYLEHKATDDGFIVHLKENIERKSTILEIIIQNDINVFIMNYDSKNIDFKRIHIHLEKIDFRTYKMVEKY